MNDAKIAVVPDDDTGSQTFDRYCYQAQSAFPYCLDCALGGQIQRVVLEHIEDIAIESRTGWRFIQIKTRDAELGPWKLDHISGKPLKSLLRAYRQLSGSNVALQLQLEGAAQRKDDLENWSRGEAVGDGIATKVAAALEIQVEECRQFLRLVEVVAIPIRRETIRAHNILLLAEHASHLPAETLSSIYDEILNKIYVAMQAQLLPTTWKRTILAGRPLRRTARELFESKCLAREKLSGIVAPLLRSPRPLLRRIVDDHGRRPSFLEQKLIAGGASPDLIAVAKQLRANASRHLLERASSAINANDQLEDVRLRLQNRMAGLVAEHNSGLTPAATIYNRLFELVGQQRSTIDAHNVFDADPDLLVGAVCDLSDECKANWGVADA